MTRHQHQICRRVNSLCTNNENDYNQFCSMCVQMKKHCVEIWTNNPRNKVSIVYHSMDSLSACCAFMCSLWCARAVKIEGDSNLPVTTHAHAYADGTNTDFYELFWLNVRQRFTNTSEMSKEIVYFWLSSFLAADNVKYVSGTWTDIILWSQTNLFSYDCAGQAVVLRTK